MALRLVALFTGFCMLITMVAVVPARADETTQAARIFTGAVALFVLGNILANQLDAQDAPVQQSTNANEGPRSYGTSTTDRTGSRQMGSSSGQSATTQRQGRYGMHQHKVLPTECAFETKRGARYVIVYGASCLEERVRKPRWLPEACEMQTQIRHGNTAHVYGAECLARRGWRTEQQARRRF